MAIKTFEKYSPLILRIALSLVFLYFGFQQAYAPDNWAGFVPAFVSGTIITANNIVIANAILELTLGVFLLLGLYTRIAALVLAAHLIGISLAMGLSPVGVRDFGLAFATFVICLNKPDRYSLDTKLTKKTQLELHE